RVRRVAHPLARATGAGDARADVAEKRRVSLFEQLEVERLLRLEMVVEHGAGDPRALRDRAHRGPVITTGCELLEGGVDDPLTSRRRRHSSPGRHRLYVDNQHTC